VKASKDTAVRDAGIIASAQKVEHFEIASYGAAREWATLLGETQAASILQQTLEEEKHADQLLTQISQERNTAAAKATAA
jgi:ferritin-like metal-binding protein YciE